MNIEHPTLNFEVGEQEVSVQWSAGRRRKRDLLWVTEDHEVAAAFSVSNLEFMI